MLRKILTFVLVSSYLAGSSALNAQFTSVKWTPGAGSPVALQPSPAITTIDSAAATGWVDVVANLAGQVRDPAVAFSIEYESDPVSAFVLADGSQFYPVERARIQTVRDGTSTRATARIVMVDRVYFDPNLIEVQVLRLWVGDAQTMTVDPVNGVTGAEHELSYRVQTIAPSFTIIPDRRSIEGPIDRPGVLECTLFRLEASDFPQAYSLAYTGEAAVLETLLAPSSVVIPAGDNGATFLVDFDPYRTLEWPGRGATVAVTAASAGETVTGYLHFSGPLMVSPYDFPAAFAPIEPEPVAGKRCVPSSVLGPQPSKPTSCGKCVKLAVTPQCPADSPGSSGAYVWYYKYSCPSGESSCTVTQHTGSYQGTDCEQWNTSCKPDGGIFARILPATVGSQVAATGHMCCFRCTPSSTYATYTFPSCQ